MVGFQLGRMERLDNVRRWELKGPPPRRRHDAGSTHKVAKFGNGVGEVMRCMRLLPTSDLN